jgi:hypothetical protein
MEDVHLWMIDQHLGRRSVSDFQRGVLALRKREILTERRASAMAATAKTDVTSAEPSSQEGPKDIAASESNPLKSRADIAKVARLSNSQVVQIEKIHKLAAPELVAAIKAGEFSINAAAAVASLPAEAQKTAALGGKDELKQAAKRVRDENRKAPKEEVHTAMNDAPEDDAQTVHTLRQQVQTLTEENQRLRQQVAALQARLQA